MAEACRNAPRCARLLTLLLLVVSSIEARAELDGVVHLPLEVELSLPQFLPGELLPHPVPKLPRLHRRTEPGEVLHHVVTGIHRLQRVRLVSLDVG